MRVRTNNGSLQFERILETYKINVISFDDRIKNGKYNATQGENMISSVWLELIGIEDEHQILFSQDFKTQRLTWRTFAHTFMIDEHEIDSDESILMPKGGARRAMGRTAFLSS